MNKKKTFLFIFWIFSIVFFECIYRMTLFNNIFDKDFMQMIIFAIPFAILMFIITNLFKEEFNKKITTVVLFIIFFVFFAQMIYFKVYYNVFSIYSMSNGGQVLEFWRTILSTIFHNLYNFVCILESIVNLMFSPFCTSILAISVFLFPSESSI